MFLHFLNNLFLFLLLSLLLFSQSSLHLLLLLFENFVVPALDGSISQQLLRTGVYQRFT